MLQCFIEKKKEFNGIEPRKVQITDGSRLIKIS